MNIEKSVKTYLDELSSSPASKSGNISALSGAIACNLGIKICNLTLSNTAYSGVHEEINIYREKLEVNRERFIELENEFDTTYASMTDEAAMNTSMDYSEVLRVCRDTLPILKMVAEKGNQNFISDAGTALLLLSSAARGAYLGIMVSCSSLTNQTIAGELLKKSAAMMNEVKDQSKFAVEGIERSLRKF